MNTASDHLNEDLLIRLLIDPTDLPQSVRDHLDECTLCRTHKKQFEQELAVFGRLAKIYSPTPRQKIYPSQPAGRLSLFPTGWGRLALAGGLTIILLMCGVLWQLSRNPSIDLLKMPTIAEIVDEPSLVADIIPSEDTHLTEIIKQVAYDANGYLEDEFVEFVAPFEFDRNSV